MKHEFLGDAAERGRQHGRLLRDSIRKRIARSLPVAASAAPGLAAPWLDAIDALDSSRGPGLGAELRGIATGAGVDLHDIVLLNAFEAFDVARQVELGGCTAVAVTGPAGAVVAQNWDANPSLAASVAVHVHSGPDIPTTVLVASPGGLGWIGMTADGVALVNNDLLTVRTRYGVPSQALRRHALRQRSTRDAVQAITSVPAVGGRAYLVTDSTGTVATVELAAEAASRTAYHSRHVAHTNHALDPQIARYEDHALVAATYPSSHARLKRARALLARADGTGCDEASTCRRILADHAGHPLSICRHLSEGEPTVTAASVVFDCGRRHASIALGNPCTSSRIEIALS
jgi:isopenicillin-N N-acyltransferase like protein